MRRFRAGVVLALAGWTLVVSAQTRDFSERQRNWWSLKAIARPATPAVKDRAWAQNPVDAFVLAKLEAAGLRPNPRADALTLLRRATIDLTGLLPTEQEIDAFLHDRSPSAWEKVIDRLLASPAYGERWGRHWLDVARYADSNGFKADETRPHIWRYRDYVVKSFNQDKPYDQFVREQIAGDELYPGNADALVAMGFNRHWIDETNAAGMLLRRQETIDEMTNATGAAFLGLTIGCARCHDHKFDPILQKDYYRLQAFFANTVMGDGPLPAATPADQKRHQEQYAAWDAKTRDLRAEMSAILEPVRISRATSGSATFEDEVKEAIFMNPSTRSPFQQVIYKTAQPRVALAEEPDARTLRTLPADKSARYAELKKQLAAFDAIKPAPLPEGQYMVDLSATAPATHVLKGGNLELKGEAVQPGFLSILDPGNATVTPLATSTGRRSALAAWLTDPANPLPARVMANRIWHYHFGRGIAATPGDLGMMGSRPTHPELLDFLAMSLIDGDWRMKPLHRMIMLSNTYQQSSADNAASAKADPDNKLLWRYQRRRMEAEALRDSMLQVSGLLNPMMGGPGVFPPLPPGTVSELSATAVAGGWRTDADPAQSNRRSLYIFVRRNLRYPLLQEFDAANTFESHAARTNTVTPSQSLDLLNNELLLEWSRSFAGRVLSDPAAAAPQVQIDRAFRLAFGRGATEEEQKIAADFLAQQAPIMAQRLAAGGRSVPPLPSTMPPGMDRARAAALVDLSHMLLDSNEFLYIN